MFAAIAPPVAAAVQAQQPPAAADTGLTLSRSWELPGWDNRAEPAAAVDLPSSDVPHAEEQMELAATWEFIGWQGNPDAPQQQQRAPWVSIYGEESLELAERRPAGAWEQGGSVDASAVPMPGMEAGDGHALPPEAATGEPPQGEAAPAVADARFAPAPEGSEEAPAVGLRADGAVPIASWSEPAANAVDGSTAQGFAGAAPAPVGAQVPAAAAPTLAPEPVTPAVAGPSAAESVAGVEAPVGPGPQATTPAAALTLEQAVGALTRASRYDTIGTTLFDFCRERFQRVLLLAVRYGTAMVVRGVGPGSTAPPVAALRIDLEQPSIFRSAASTRAPTLIRAPTEAQEVRFFEALADAPVEGAIVPVMCGTELVDLLYVDCGANPLPSSVMEDLARLAQAAAEAHERPGTVS